MAIGSKTYTPEELNTILGQFKIAPKLYAFQALTNGFINDTLLVKHNERPLYILQGINKTVFEDVEGLMTNMNRALTVLKAENYQRIKLIPALSGKSYSLYQSKYWRVMSYIPSSTTFNTTRNTKIAFEAGRIIGKFHTLLQHEKLTRYSDTIYKFHDLELRKMQFLSALARASKERNQIANDAISFVEGMLKKLEGIRLEHLPQRICHNDTKLNNILFSTETQKALCLIDLDTVMKGYFHFDFGDAIRTIVNTAPEDAQDHTKITFETKLFETFIDGMASNDEFLNKQEIEVLPYGVLLMPFLHGLRALTDFLNANIYYKVSYENQNLDRSLSLFDFTQKAFAKQSYMASVVAQKLTPIH